MESGKLLSEDGRHKKQTFRRFERKIKLNLVFRQSKNKAGQKKKLERSSQFSINHRQNK